MDNTLFLESGVPGLLPVWAPLCLSSGGGNSYCGVEYKRPTISVGHVGASRKLPNDAAW